MIVFSMLTTKQKIHQNQQVSMLRESLLTNSSILLVLLLLFLLFLSAWFAWEYDCFYSFLAVLILLTVYLICQYQYPYVMYGRQSLLFSMTSDSLEHGILLLRIEQFFCPHSHPIFTVSCRTIVSIQEGKCKRECVCVYFNHCSKVYCVHFKNI